MRSVISIIAEDRSEGKREGTPNARKCLHWQGYSQLSQGWLSSNGPRSLSRSFSSLEEVIQVLLKRAFDQGAAMNVRDNAIRVYKDAGWQASHAVR